jgi:hypothetical protein
LVGFAVEYTKNPHHYWGFSFVILAPEASAPADIKPTVLRARQFLQEGTEVHPYTHQLPKLTTTELKKAATSLHVNL